MKLEFLYIVNSIYNKKLINIKFGLKVYFFGQNRLKYKKYVSCARAYEYDFYGTWYIR